MHTHSIRALCALLALGALVACGDSDPAPSANAATAADAGDDAADSGTSDTETRDARTAPELLVDHTAWTFVEAADDPWRDERPDPLECPNAAYRPEDDALEILTGFCDYLTITQPTLRDAYQGETLTAIVRHLDLVDEDDPEASAEAHVAIQVGDTVLWDDRIPIPNVSGFYTPNIVLAEDVPQGTPILFHLHNHGTNTWYLQNLLVSAE